MSTVLDASNLEIALEKSVKLEQELYRNFVINPDNRLDESYITVVMETYKQLRKFNYMARRFRQFSTISEPENA